jgi:hypothetical protein
MLCVIMLGAAMLNLTADSRLAFKVMPWTNTLAYSATARKKSFDVPSHLRLKQGDRRVYARTPLEGRRLKVVVVFGVLRPTVENDVSSPTQRESKLECFFLAWHSSQVQYFRVKLKPRQVRHLILIIYEY